MEAAADDAPTPGTVPRAVVAQLKPKKELTPKQRATETKKRVGWRDKAKARVAEIAAAAASAEEAEAIQIL
jgi:hypothetical protein